MRWFKHLSNSHLDEKLSSIMDEYGLEIYGFWWVILEIIASQMGETPKTNCVYSAKTWGKFAGISAKKFQKFANILEEKKLIIMKIEENEIEINVPNMLKFRDEYTTKKQRRKL